MYVCVLLDFEAYLRRIESVTKDKQPLVSFTIFKSMSTYTVARWLKYVL